MTQAPQAPPSRPTPIDSVDGVRALVDEVSRETCRIEWIHDGPALVRGAAAVVDPGGRATPAARPVVAVCTCALTQRAPWCDGTHKVARS
jgi:hypothetical protein